MIRLPANHLTKTKPTNRKQRGDPANEEHVWKVSTCYMITKFPTPLSITQNLFENPILSPILQGMKVIIFRLKFSLGTSINGSNNDMTL